MKAMIVFLSMALLQAPCYAVGLGQEEDKIDHALNRITFGARPGDREKVKALGLQKFIDAQLSPSTIAESPIVIQQLADTADLRQSSKELIAKFVELRKQQKALKKQAEAVAQSQSDKQGQGGDMQVAAGKRKLGGPGSKYKNLVESGAIETKLVRAIESPRQLNELLTDFWFKHFNVCMTKGVDRVLVSAYEEQAIRPNVLGKFRNLLGSTMHHPAMMFYLDNAQNTKAGFAAKNPNNKRKGINENYARELLELHTLGVDGGYTQKDIMELARVLTGWGMPPLRGNVSEAAAYWASFDPRRHDFGDKVVLGRTIKGTGAGEIEQVLDMLAVHPSTANRVAFKLAQFFVDDNPPQLLVDKLAVSFKQSGGDIRTVLKTLFATSEFWDQKYTGNKFKSPLHFTVSTYRATGLRVEQPKLLVQFLKTQGQPIYACLTPDGYKYTKEAWLNPDGLMKRIDFASRLSVANRNSLDYQNVLPAVNGGKLSEKTLTAISSAPPTQKVGALLGSPEFMRY